MVGSAQIFTSGLAAKVGPQAVCVWLAIDSFADPDNGEAQLSVRRLMELTGLASATVQAALAALHEAGMLRARRWGVHIHHTALAPELPPAVFTDVANKERARWLVQSALRSGRLSKPLSCEISGCGGAPEAHHDDYGQPLKVQWLCRLHHKHAHMEAAQ